MSLDKESFKHAMSLWASGVTVVTTQWNGEHFGLTASSFSSVSLEPTLVSVNLAKSLYTHALLQQSGTFAVSILAADQVEIGSRFAGMIPEIEDRFEGLQTKISVTGCRILPGCLAWVDCRVVHGFEAGDHTIFVGEVLTAGASDGGQPLLYFNHDWRYLGDK
jgi:flavin reductase (DIM6/NTAB) family NADH-FMN oxidoreductase RutF